MMVPDTWDDVKRRKNDFVSKTIFFVFHCAKRRPETLGYGLGKHLNRCY